VTWTPTPTVPTDWTPTGTEPEDWSGSANTAETWFGALVDEQGKPILATETQPITVP